MRERERDAEMEREWRGERGREWGGGGGRGDGGRERGRERQQVVLVPRKERSVITAMETILRTHTMPCNEHPLHIHLKFLKDNNKTPPCQVWIITSLTQEVGT